MKLLHVTIGTTVLQFGQSGDLYAIVGGFAGVEVYEKNYDGVLTLKGDNPTFEFINTENTAANPAVAAAKAECDQFRRWWSEGNNKACQQDAEIKALKASLAMQGDRPEFMAGAGQPA